ncbi:hypothetical protein SAMN05444487_101274 [Marininema mesophilum]|uniref:Type II secretory pathway, pseudopilin PulG n=1 Tax=Marininema mesophilum TaxID=1048340 RepID=A0A1H2QPE6_9BACL|nr:hypothetical protein [Marininema mesophilum]SDW08991.1 hypothetical protein SAMN05444487_101274 [Marininema mesophilum]
MKESWQVVRNERGLALPMVLAVTILLFLILTAVLTQLVREGHARTAEWKMIRAQYAAESGIARMQSRLCVVKRPKKLLTTQMNGLRTETKIDRYEKNAVHVISIAHGKGVKQTIKAKLARDNCTIQKWGR